MAPLPIVGRGVLSTSSFHVPMISHVPQVTIELVSTGQITDHDCCIILDFDSCCVQDLRMGLLVGTGPRRHDSKAYGSLTGCIFLRLLWPVNHPVPLPLLLLPLYLLLLSGIIVSVISPACDFPPLLIVVL